MSEAKHTPGPWIISNENGATRILAEGNESIMGDASYDAWTPNNYADWNLIAAAPELLEALKVMLAEKDDYMRRNKLGDPHRETASKMARAAIAKAEGRDQ